MYENQSLTKKRYFSCKDFRVNCKRYMQAGSVCLALQQVEACSIADTVQAQGSGRGTQSNASVMRIAWYGIPVGIVAQGAEP